MSAPSSRTRPISPPTASDGSGPRGGARRRAALRLGALSTLLTAVGIVALFVVPVSRDGIESFVDPFGPAAPVVFVLVSAVLGALFVPGPLLSAASGALFGTWLGFAVSTASSVLSAVLSAAFGDRAGRASAEELGDERVEALVALARRRGFAVVVLQRWIPGIPDSPFSYLFGVLGIGLRAVALGTALGSAPRAFAYTALGDAAITDNTGLVVAAVVVGGAISLVGVVVGVVVVRRHRRAPADPAGPSSPA